MFGHRRIPSREGGVDIVVKELSTRMAAQGHEVVCYNRGKHKNGGALLHKPKDRIYEGVTVKTVPTLDFKGLAALSSSFIAAVVSSLGDSDVVHIHAEGPAFFSWIPKLFGKRVVVTIHGLDWQREKWGNSFGSWFIHAGEKNAAKFADEVIVLSRNAHEYFKKTYDRETVWIPNGADKLPLAEPDLIKREYGVGKEDYLFYLGRLVPEKGVHYLIEAFKKVKTDKKLIITGGASDTEAYAEKLRKLAEGDERIIFTGFLQGDVLAELYSNNYAYILPSNVEGMPLSLLEAMSYSSCCIVSDIPECAEVVEDKALTFPKGNVDELRKCLQKICDNPEIVKSYKQNARDYICEKYCWDDIVAQTLELYKK